VCHEVFTPIRRAKGIYCSRPCANTGVSRATAKQRADKLRDSGEGRTYRKRDGRHEHRIVAEEKLGRPLRRGEVVHHIDHDFRNNDSANLAVMTQGEHMREHGLGIPGAPLAHRPWEKRWAS
jgi:hypothetical protein